MTVTAVTTPSVDQQVQLMSADAPLAAIIVNIWEDGKVDIVVNDHSVPESFQVKRLTYVPYGVTFTPPTDPVTGQVIDRRYARQLQTGDGLPAAAILDTEPTIGGDDANGGPGTEPLES
jgi:hypothetical protein